MNVPAGREIAAGAGEHHAFDLRRVGKLAKCVTKLGIAVEGQRVLALGPVERDRRDSVVKRPQEVGGLEGLGVETHALVPPSIVTAAPFTSRLCGRHRVRIMVPIPSGSTSRPLAFMLVMALRAWSSLRPVICDTRAIDWLVIGVSTYPGQTAFTVR